MQPKQLQNEQLIRLSPHQKLSFTCPMVIARFATDSVQLRLAFVQVGSMDDLQAHFEREHSDCLPKIPCSRKEDSFDVEEMGVVGKKYGAVLKCSEVPGNSKKKKSVQKMVGKFPCIVCKKKFPVRNDMKNHVRKVHFAKVIQCGLCDNQVKDTEMRKHINKYHPG